MLHMSLFPNRKESIFNFLLYFILVGSGLVTLYTLVLFPGLKSAEAYPNTPSTTPWIADAQVNAIDVGDDGTVYIGGSFTYLGPYTGAGVAINKTTGALPSVFPPITGSNPGVYASISDGNGGWYVGGTFTTIGGVDQTNLAHINSDGTVDVTFNPGISGTIYALALRGNILFIGGSVYSVNVDSRYGVAAIDATTGDTLPWNPSTQNSWDTVYSLKLDGTVLYVGGSFSNIASTNRNGLVALDTSLAETEATATTTSWDPSPTAFATVYDIEIDGNNVYVGGSFTSIGSDTRNYLAQIDKTTGAATSWNPEADYIVRAIEINGGSVFVGGYFNSVSGVSHMYVAEINASTGLATSWDPAFIGSGVYDLKVDSDTVYVGGSFTSVGGQSQENAVALDRTTAVSKTLSSALNTHASVHSLALQGNELFVGGTFSSLGGVKRNGIAAINPNTGIPTSWNPNSNNTIYAIDADGTTVYVGGNFTNIGGADRSEIAALDIASGNATAWDPSINTFGTVNKIIVNGNSVYVGGSFSTVGGDDRKYLAEIDKTSGSSTSWAPALTGGFNGVMAMAVGTSSVYVGGDFTSVGGDGRNYLAEIDRITGSSTAWNTDANAKITAIAVDENTIYVGGDFTSFNTAMNYRNYMAAFQRGTSSPLPLNPSPQFMCGACTRIKDLIVGSDGLYVVGAFQTIAGVSRSGGIAVINTSTGDAMDWRPYFAGGFNPVETLYVTSTRVYAVGTFTTAGRTGLSRFAQFGPNFVQFSSTTWSQDESATSPQLIVEISSSNTSTRPITVNYTVTGGSATGGGNDYTLANGTATISAGSPSTTIPLTVINDSTMESDETVVVTLSSPTNAVLGSQTSLTYTIQNDDVGTPGITLSESASSTAITEGGAVDTYTLNLDTAPSADVTIALSSDSSQVSLSASSLTFTTSNWNVPQTVTTTAVDDDIAEGNHFSRITHSVTSADSTYNAMSVSSVNVAITDNGDTAGVTVTESSGGTNVNEGSLSDTYTLTLTSQPTSTVTIAVASDSTEISLSTSSVSFNSSNWNQLVTVTVSAVDDEEQEGAETATITHTVTSNNWNYSGISVSSVTTTISDNDTHSASSGGSGAGDTGGQDQAAPAQPPQLPAITPPPAAPTPQVLTLTEPGASIPVSIGGSNHTVTPVNITPELVTMIIRSEPVEVTLLNGEEKAIDLDGDELYDVKVAYAGLVDGQPQIRITPLEDNGELQKAVTINRGAFETNTRRVVLNFNVNKVSAVAISNTNDFSKVKFIPFEPSMMWELNPGAGVKTVYIRFKSQTGGMADVEDSITYKPDSYEYVIDGKATKQCPLEVGKPYKTSDSAAVYLIVDGEYEDCVKQVFTNSRVYFTYFDSWKDVQTAEKKLLDVIPNHVVSVAPLGPKHKLFDGALVKTVTNSKVFIQTENKLRWISSPNVFVQLGYAWSWVQDISRDLFRKYTIGEDVTESSGRPAGTFIRYDNNPNKVYKIDRDTKTSTTLKRPVVDETIQYLEPPFDYVPVVSSTEQYKDGTEVELFPAVDPSLYFDEPAEETLVEFSRNLKVGDTGKDVEQLQIKLKQLGLFKADVTQKFGSVTKEAVMEFQKKNKLSPTGIVGPETREILNKI